MIQNCGVEPIMSYMLQNDLYILGEWAMRNQMPFNIEKCKVTHIGKRNAKFEFFNGLQNIFNL